ncbi:MAG: PilZ domain-containing protein [Desulfobacterales bacterium]|jgi:hypothetical protein
MIRLNLKMNRRKHKRYPGVEGAIVAVRPQAEILGQMIDVGLGGLSFQYIDSAIDESPSDELTILMSSPRLYLDRIPYRTVADFALPQEFSFSAIPVRRRCVAFDHLTPEKCDGIKQLILYCTLIKPRFCNFPEPRHHDAPLSQTL